MHYIEYAQLLTLDVSNIKKKHFDNLKSIGCSDGEILEVNQVIAYFNYANRTALGLGVTTNGESLGLSPNNKDDENAWNHN